MSVKTNKLYWFSNGANMLRGYLTARGGNNPMAIIMTVANELTRRVEYQWFVGETESGTCNSEGDAMRAAEARFFGRA